MGRTSGLGIGTIVILGLIGWALGIDPRLLIGGAEILSGTGGTQQIFPAATRGYFWKWRCGGSSAAVVAR